MGVVWHARDEVLGRDVAVKEIRVPALDEPVEPLARRALREARAAARLHHPGIVMVHDVVTHDGRPWIVMELVHGRSLAQVIAADGPLPARRAADVGRQVLDALGAAHRRGILHRDVKPANILFDGDRVVLTDFGIAAIDGATALTATGLLVGSPDYLAPERIDGRPPTTAIDMWGLGATLYTAVAGRPPFHREDTRSTLAAVLVSEPEPLDSAPDLWPVIRGLLAKSPETRLTLTDAVPLLAAAMGTPSTAPPGRRRWTAMVPGRSRVGAASMPARSSVDRAEQPSPAPAAASTQVEAGPESPPIATRPVTRPTVPRAGSGPAVGTRSRSRTITLIAALVVVFSLVGTVGWMAQRGPDDPVGPTTAISFPAVSSLASAGKRTTSPSPSPSTPPAPAGFEVVGGSGWNVLLPRFWTSDGANEWSSGAQDAPRISVAVRYYTANGRMAAGTELIKHEEWQSNGSGGVDYKRLRLTRRLPTIKGTGSVAEIEYTRTRNVAQASLTVPKSPSPMGFHFWPVATSVRFDLGMEPQRLEEAREVGIKPGRGPVHLGPEHSRSIDRAFVTKAGGEMYVVSVRIDADTSDELRHTWPRNLATVTRILNSFRFTSN